MLPTMLLAAAVGGGDKYVITVGNSGTSYGWDGTGTTFGSIVPNVGASGIPIANSRVINAIYTPTAGGSDLTILSDGAGALQTDFTSIYVQRSDGTYDKYDTSAATFNGTTSSWNWGAGTDDVFENTSSGEARGIVVVI